MIKSQGLNPAQSPRPGAGTCIIAIDGPAASGKGTLARRLAKVFGLAHLDTGLIYRATAARLLSGGGDPDDSDALAQIALDLQPEDLQRSDLRQEHVAQITSKVAACPAVRTALLQFQRNFTNQLPDGSIGAILDGRDIGTVIFPDASLKFFITASDEVRAERRHKELLARGEESIYGSVLEDLRERDRRDASRAAAPMRAADDAILLDTSVLDVGAVFRQAADKMTERLGLSPL